MSLIISQGTTNSLGMSQGGRVFTLGCPSKDFTVKDWRGLAAACRGEAPVVVNRDVIGGYIRIEVNPLGARGTVRISHFCDDDSSAIIELPVARCGAAFKKAAAHNE